MNQGYAGKRWTREERERAFEMREQGMKYREIAKVLNRTKDSLVHAFRVEKPCLAGAGPIRESARQAALRKQLYGELRYDVG